MSHMFPATSLSAQHRDMEEVQWILRKVVSTLPKIEEHVHYLRDTVHLLHCSRRRPL